MNRRVPLALLVALAAALPVVASARLTTVPLEAIAGASPAAAAPQCHEATDELSAAVGACALCATCHLPPAPPAAPAATGSAPRPAATPAPAPREAERRSTRRQAERLDRPPFIRPM